MARDRLTFRQRDAAAALRAARQAGLSPKHMKIDKDGNIVISFDGPQEAIDRGHEWDVVQS